MLKDNEVKWIMHYLDDYLTISSGSDECLHNMAVMSECCSRLGVPLSRTPYNIPRILGYHARHQSDGGKTIRKEGGSTHGCITQVTGAHLLSIELTFDCY